MKESRLVCATLQRVKTCILAYWMLGRFIVVGSCVMDLGTCELLGTWEKDVTLGGSACSLLLGDVLAKKDLHKS